MLLPHCLLSPHQRTASRMYAEKYSAAQVVASSTEKVLSGVLDTMKAARQSRSKARSCAAKVNARKTRTDECSAHQRSAALFLSTTEATSVASVGVKRPRRTCAKARAPTARTTESGFSTRLLLCLQRCLLHGITPRVVADWPELLIHLIISCRTLRTKCLVARNNPMRSIKCVHIEVACSSGVVVSRTTTITKFTRQKIYGSLCDLTTALALIVEYHAQRAFVRPATICMFRGIMLGVPVTRNNKTRQPVTRESIEALRSSG